jgi:VCBS repeat protein
LSWRELARLAALACLGAYGCARLPEIAPGECGNGVVDPGEDCDTFYAEGGPVCRPRGSAGQCHFDCNRALEGWRTQCPAGWGCAVDSVCRPPTGQFEALPESEIGSADSLLTGDFDGDGRADLASVEAPDSGGATLLEFHYFDDQARLDETRPFPKSLLSPVVRDVSADGQSDVVFSDQALGVLLGRTDRSWVPETFSSYHIPDTSILTTSVSAGPVQGTSGFLVFALFEGVSGVYVPDTPNTGLPPRRLGTLPGPNEALVSTPVSGRVIEDISQSPCLQVVLAVRGESSFELIDPCASDSSGLSTWRAPMQEWHIQLDPPEPITKAPLILDVDGDGHGDVLIGTDSRAYLARGDGRTLSVAVPYHLPVADAGTLPSEIGMPLAAGDLTGDGALDFVFDSGLLLSSPSADPSLFVYQAADLHPPGYWSSAAIADFNGNGKLDVVAASSTHANIDFFNGTQSVDLIGFRVPTARPVKEIAVGDFDADQLTDVAFTQLGTGQGPANAVLMAFGAPAGAPLAPLTVARLNDIQQMNPYREGPLSHLILSSNESTATGRGGALAILASSSNRIPTASYALTTFAANNSTDESTALKLASGGFTAPGSGDVLAVAIPAGDPQLSSERLEFWLLPALGTSAGTPVRLQGGFAPELHPAAAGPGRANLRFASAAGDVDADGRDELLFASPAEDDEHCQLVVARVDAEQMLPRTSLHLDEPCSVAQLLPVDVDNDGSIDIVLLGARADGTGGQLSVFWNDGQAGFSGERLSRVSDAADSPRAFSVLGPTPTRGLSFVYATADELRSVESLGAARDFGSPGSLPDVPGGCTGVVAADLNGDGATDLGLARMGNLRVLKAILEPL